MISRAWQGGCAAPSNHSQTDEAESRTRTVSPAFSPCLVSVSRSRTGLFVSYCTPAHSFRFFRSLSINEGGTLPARTAAFADRWGMRSRVSPSVQQASVDVGVGRQKPRKAHPLHRGKWPPRQTASVLLLHRHRFFSHACIRSALFLLPFKMGYNNGMKEKEGPYSAGMALHGFAEDCRMGTGIWVYRAILSPTAESRCTANQLVLFATPYSAIFRSIGCATQVDSKKLQ